MPEPPAVKYVSGRIGTSCPHHTIHTSPDLSGQGPRARARARARAQARAQAQGCLGIPGPKQGAAHMSQYIHAITCTHKNAHAKRVCARVRVHVSVGVCVCVCVFVCVCGCVCVCVCVLWLLEYV